ncbi:MAG: hypothetical protein WAM73_18540 [Desulfobacterales bacterium]
MGKIVHQSRIDVAYTLKLPKEQVADARAALENYLHLCPAAQSVIDCIRITHNLTLPEM